MKKIVSVVLVATMMSTLLISCDKSYADAFSGKLENEVDSVSYAIGLNIAENLKNSGFDSIDVSALASAIESVYAGDSALITTDQAGVIINNYMMKASQAKAAGAKQAGLDFLTENGKKPGVITTASGLQYEIIKEGTGKQPLATDVVTVHYQGTLIDGTVFDSSLERGEPATFPLNGVIPGWTEGLQLLKEGSKARLYIPSDLAYGDNGAGDLIGPGSTLIFDVELLKVGE